MRKTNQSKRKALKSKVKKQNLKRLKRIKKAQLAIQPKKKKNTEWNQERVDSWWHIRVSS